MPREHLLPVLVGPTLAASLLAVHRAVRARAAQVRNFRAAADSKATSAWMPPDGPAIFASHSLEWRQAYTCTGAIVCL